VAAEGALVFDYARKFGLEGDRVEASRQPLSQRAEPELAEVPEP
jgi:hypothetical protein